MQNLHRRLSSSTLSLIFGILAAIGVAGFAPADELPAEEAVTETTDPTTTPAAATQRGELTNIPPHCTRYGLSPAEGTTVENAPAGQDLLHQSFTSGSTTSEYHLFTDGVDFSQPVGLVVRLHGDGGYEFRNPGGVVDCLASVAASHNMVVLSPLAPAAEDRWWHEMDRSRAWVTDLVADVNARYGIDTSNIWWMGYSGGAEFLSYSLALHEPELISGGAVLVGGGGAPSWARNPAPATGAPLLWAVGTQDNGTSPRARFDALSAAQQGSSYYAGRGFSGAQLKLYEGNDHFNMPDAAILHSALTHGSL